MQRFSFENDYSEGAYAPILEALMSTNMQKVPGYGLDPFCDSAKNKIRKACDCPDADIYFISGGTQTNLIVISGMLASYEAVIAAQTGHVNDHEAGSIECTGHKVLTLPQIDGKISAKDLLQFLRDFDENGNKNHMVQPGMVYISHPTEYGTLYSLDELREIHAVCKEYSLPLFVDGARLGYGIASRSTDVSLADMAANCDVFYIGGTKVGALCGEAVVFTHNNAPAHFFTSIKQHGALLAKGRLLGIQFDVLFTDDAYIKLGRNAIDTAERMKEIFAEKGYEFYIDSPTNQIFIVLTNADYDRLARDVRFSFWEKLDENRKVVRFATSWATKMEEVNEFAKIL